MPLITAFPPRYPMRLLFASVHCYLDPSSGAALCTRELLAARGMDCRVLTTGILEPERETSLDEVFATLELPQGRFIVRSASCQAPHPPGLRPPSPGGRERDSNLLPLGEGAAKRRMRGQACENETAPGSFPPGGSRRRWYGAERPRWSTWG
jgi:hypothetical protein